MASIFESPDKGKTVYRRPLGQLEPRELVPPNEMEVMTVELNGIIHVEYCERVGTNRCVRPVTEITCSHCCNKLKEMGML